MLSFAMSQYPSLISLLRRFGLPPQKVVLTLADLLALLGTAVAVFLLRAAFGDLDPILYRWVMPLLLLGRCSARVWACIRTSACRRNAN